MKSSWHFQSRERVPVVRTGKIQENAKSIIEAGKLYIYIYYCI